MKFSEIMMDIRDRNHMTQEEFAERLFVTRQAVSRWETGASIPNVDTCKVISEQFGISLDTLLGTERNTVCQSCIYPLHNINELGTNADGTLNTDYCIYCYKDGQWVDPNYTVQQVIDHTVPFWTSPTMTAEQARARLAQEVPKLKRWRQI